MKNLISNFILSGAGVSVFLFVLARVMPNEKLHDLGFKLGKAASLLGVSRLGKTIWEKIEDFFENSSTVFFAGLREGLDSDDEPGDPTALAPLVSGAVLLIALLASPAMGADLKVSVGALDLQVPFAQTEAVYLYDVLGKRGLVGAETIVAAIKGIEASVGVVTDADLDGAPFLGVRRLVPSGVLRDSLYVGVWLGRDFRNDAYQAGIKASVALWGNSRK